MYDSTLSFDCLNSDEISISDWQITISLNKDVIIATFDLELEFYHKFDTRLTR